MDDLQTAALLRARAAIDIAAGTLPRDAQAARAKEFVDVALAMLPARSTAEAVEHLRASSPSSIVRKAVAHSVFGDELWHNDDARALAQAYLASIAENSVLDQLTRYARMLPAGSRRVLLASDAVGDVVAEGDPKPVRSLTLSLGDVEPTKAAAIVVLSRELVDVGGDAMRVLFERELRAAVGRACNQSILGRLVTSDAIEVAGTGDPLADLRAGLRAAGPSLGFVAAMPAGDVADLATRTENRGGMGIRGGTFVPGVEVVAIDGAVQTVVIPASRLALWDRGLEIRPAGHATVDMRDSPDSPAAMVSLWQTGCYGLLVERNWHLAGDVEGVVVVGS